MTPLLLSSQETQLTCTRQLEEMRQLKDKEVTTTSLLEEKDEEITELSNKLIKESDIFQNLKRRFARTVKVSDEATRALNAKQRENESLKQEMETLQTNMAIVQAQVSCVTSSTSVYTGLLYCAG